MVVYADNFQVIAREENDVASILSTLRDSLREHPAGPLRPRFVDQLTPATTEFEFLGYVFRPNGGEVSVAPSCKNLAKFDHKFAWGIDRATRPEASIEKRKRELKHLRRYVRSWTAAFSLWSEVGSFRDKKLALIHDVYGGLDEPEPA